MTTLTGKKFYSKTTKNILTVTSETSKKLMVTSSCGSESMHDRAQFEDQVANYGYIEQSSHTSTELLAEITQIVAVEIKGGFRIDAELSNGETITLKNKSTRKPTAIQLYSCRANGNSPENSDGKFFGFAKSVSSYEKEFHLKGYLVA
jgi:hypothetical protein